MERSDHPPESDDDDMLPEYDLRGGIRGKYYRRYHGGGCVVVLDPDVAAEFQDSESVNAALRALLKDRSVP
jgi:hypothetical protein